MTAAPGDCCNGGRGILSRPPLFDAETIDRKLLKWQISATCETYDPAGKVYTLRCAPPFYARPKRLESVSIPRQEDPYEVSHSNALRHSIDFYVPGNGRRLCL